MKPKKVICPICGEEMIPENWGMKRDIMQNIVGQKFPSNYAINYVDYVCSCGNVMEYKGTTDCWQKCKCKSYDVNFQDHYPCHEKGCECKSCKDVPVKIGDKLVDTDEDLKRTVPEEKKRWSIKEWRKHWGLTND